MRRVFARGVVSYKDSILSHELQSLIKVIQEPRGLQRDTHALEGEQSGMMPCGRKTMAAGLPMSINPQITHVRMKLAMCSDDEGTCFEHVRFYYHLSELHGLTANST